MLNDFQAAIVARLAADVTVKTATILQEDAADLATQIEEAIGQTGMIVIVGQPSAHNAEASVKLTPMPANFQIELQIAVGEMPSIWRDANDTAPHAAAMADAIVTSLQGFTVAGFMAAIVTECKFVSDPKRQLYNLTINSRRIVNPVA